MLLFGTFVKVEIFVCSIRCNVIAGDLWMVEDNAAFTERGMTLELASSRVEKIYIYRKGNDIRIGVIPRYEGSQEVPIYVNSIIN